MSPSAVVGQLFLSINSSFYMGVDDDFVRGEVTSPYFVYIHQVYYQTIANTLLVHAIRSWAKLLTHTQHLDVCITGTTVCEEAHDEQQAGLPYNGFSQNKTQTQY